MTTRSLRAFVERLETRRLFNTIVHVDANAPGVNPDGTSWATAYTDLQQALTVATAGTDIWLANGTYRPTTGMNREIAFELKDNVSIYGGYAGFGAADPDARDIGTFTTNVSGDIGVAGDVADNSYHVLSARAAQLITSATILDGLTIRDGNADGPLVIGNENFSNAGGLTIYDSSLVVSRCTFTANIGRVQGGAVRIADSDHTVAPPRFSDCVFLANKTLANTGYFTEGGAICLFGDAMVERCIFKENFSDNLGGGIYAALGSLTLRDSVFIRNIAFGGGGVDLESSATATITNCTFNGNRALVGGGLRVKSGGVQGGSHSTVSVVSSAFVGNVADLSTAPWRAGAVYVYAAEATLTNCTIVANSARTAGGAIYAAIDPTNQKQPICTVANSILWANTAPTSPQVNDATIAYSDVQGGFTGTANINADPQFVRNPSPGADNVWCTADDDYGDLRFQINSPSIDAGNNASVPPSATTDIAGRSRRFDFPGVSAAGAIVDMGANELDLRLGLLRVAADQTLSLPAGGHTFFVEQLDVASGATLDVRDDSLMVDYQNASQLAVVRALINNARAGGAWTGSGITSSNARNNPLHNTTLGAIEASEFKSIYGPAATFGGHAIDNTCVLIKYTFYGDTDFNGVVDFDDYSRIDAGFNRNKSGWLNGDVDGNGIVDFDDYSLIDQAFNTQGAARRPIVAPSLGKKLRGLR